jgi:SulP family sulfate permease
MLIPKLFSIFKNRNQELTKEQIIKDIVSGVIVAIIALPLSIALAIASGVSPEKGLITAIIGGFLISFLGGSRVQIGGPTGAFVIIIYGIVQKFGIQGLAIATIMAGIILVISGVLKFGSVIKYIPYPIVTGFTAGIAVVLFSTQIKDFLGIKAQEVPTEFFEKWGFYFSHLNSVHLETLLIGVLAVLIIVYMPKVNKNIPGSLIALIVTTGLVQIFNMPIETIGSRFGEISSTISVTKFDGVDFKMIKELINPAITIAILAGIESLLSAVVADGMIGKKHNSNMELVAQGVANICSAFFGGIPATGAIARTAANVKNGGRTPIAGIVHAIVLLLILLIFMPFAKLIPMTTLAAILIVVAYNMSEHRAFRGLLKSTKSDISVLITTFLLTVIFDLVVAIEVGIILAMFLFIKKSSDSTQFNKVNCYYEDKLEDDDSQEVDKQECLMDNKKVLVYEINGPLFFGAASTFLDVINQVNSSADILILRMKNVPILDATSFNALKRIDERCRKNHIMLLFTEVQQKPMELLVNMGFVEKAGGDRFFNSVNDAMKTSKEILLIKNSLHKN